MYGFSIRQMRRLFGSRDEQAVRRIQDRLRTKQLHWRADELQEVSEVVERAIMRGIPFSDLIAEANNHCLAAGALARHEQEWLVTDASAYHASALQDGLWKQYGRHARPEIRAFLRGMVEGVPLFGRQPPPDDSAYAAISLEKLRFFQAGLEDFRQQVIYRVGRKKDPSDEDQAAVEFVTEFCGWIDEIRDAERDLWVMFG